MKLFDDLLKYNNKYSRKSLIIFVFLIFIIIVGSYIVIDKEYHDKAVQVFDSSLIFLATLLGISIADKKLLSKNKPPEEDI